MFAILHVRWLSHIFNRTASIYQTATRWDLPPYRTNIWLIDDVMLIFVCLLDVFILGFCYSNWHEKPVDSNSHRLSSLYYKRIHQPIVLVTPNIFIPCKTCGVFRVGIRPYRNTKFTKLWIILLSLTSRTLTIKFFKLDLMFYVQNAVYSSDPCFSVLMFCVVMTYILFSKVLWAIFLCYHNLCSDFLWFKVSCFRF